MNPTQYQFRFGTTVKMTDVEETMALAVIAAEGLHGRARVQLDGQCETSRDGRTCTVNADTAVGRDIARIFTEILNLEIGESAFSVAAGSSQ